MDRKRKMQIARLLETLGDALLQSIQARLVQSADIIPPEEHADYINLMAAYRVIGVEPSEAPAVLEAVYQAKRKMYHPDNQATGDAEKFKALQTAYETIRNSPRPKTWVRESII